MNSAGKLEITLKGLSPKTVDSAATQISKLFDEGRYSGPESLSCVRDQFQKMKKLAKVHRRRITVNDFNQEELALIEAIQLPSLLVLEFRVF